MRHEYIAHRNENTGETQSVREHSENVAKYCEIFAVPELKTELYVMGLLHDVGKYQESFVRRIHGADIRIEHAVCGARIADEHWHSLPTGLLMAYCIAGHHTGLPDGGDRTDDASMTTLSGRLKRETEDYTAYKDELCIPEIDTGNFVALLRRDCSFSGKAAIEWMIDKFAFFTRYAYSCLVDADSLDTALFCGEDPCLHPLKADFTACFHRVEKRLTSLSCTSALQKARSTLQEQAYREINRDAEIYLLNMPTGSGKTLCSIKCALMRAIKDGKKRIIYVIPYNSIIDQTAEIFSEIFGEYGDILRHQSTFSYGEKGEDDEYLYGARYATENWDAPIIITTVAQFFGSLFSNARGKLRKVHNLQDAVIVFDEAHLMPVSCLQPCLQSVGYITRYLHSRAIFMTATMPDFSTLLSRCVMPGMNIHQLIQDTRPFSLFQKCTYVYLGEMSREEVIQKSMDAPSSLIVVNRRRTAREFYAGCTGRKYHLSTYMTALDRIRVIDEIRRELNLLEKDYPDLKDVPACRRITVVSTSLIEAGVDFDFHTVFRECAGLDNILQAGGRCNREGKRKNAQVLVFDYREDGGSRTDDRTNLTRGLLKKYENISAPDCIREYYDRLYFMREGEILKNAMHNYCTTFSNVCFKEYAGAVKIIDSAAENLVVPTDEEGQGLVDSLRYNGFTNFRKMQKYTCSVYESELEELRRQHAAEDFGTGTYCLTNRDYYKSDIGITFEAIDYIL